MNLLIPVEFNNQRILTTEQLAQVYDTDIKNISNNFNRNKDKFIEGKHYYLLQGEVLKQFKAIHLNDESLKFVSQLYLWTLRGANRHCKILDTDKAWEQFDYLEETYFRVKEDKPVCIEDVLIQSLQEMKNLRLQLTETRKQTENVRQEVQGIREVVEIRPSETWRNDTNKIIKKICYQLSDYQKPKDQIYKALQERAACDLKRRLENMRARLLMKGGSKSKADALNYIDVIAEDKKLIEIYTMIIKEMAIKYKVA